MTALVGPGERHAHVLWLSSFTLVFVLHAGLLAAVLTRGPELEEGIPSETITVDFSPEPSTASPQPEAAPGPPLPEPATPSAEQVAEGELEPPAPEAPPSTVAEARPEPKVSLPPEPPPAIEPAVTLPDRPPQPEPPMEVEADAAKPQVSTAQDAPPHRSENWTGTVSSSGAAMPTGGAGSGCARSIRARLSRSSASTPELLTRAFAITRPERSSLTRTVATPLCPRTCASAG